MAYAKFSLYGSDFIGAFGVASDKFILVGRDISRGGESVIKETLNCKVVRCSVGGSELVGIYAVANSGHVLLSNMTEDSEVKFLRNELGNVSVEVLDTDLNALRNNILTNDKLAVLNPEFTSRQEKEISDLLDVETIRTKTGGFSTVGANNILTNKGMVLSNHASDEEFERFKEFFPSLTQSTANTGSPSIGLCTMANSGGLLAGEKTTGYELANMADALGL